MAVDEKLARSRPGATAETSNKPRARAGVWRHPETGAELITIDDALYGNGTSEAAKRTGFEYVGPAPDGSIKTIPGMNAESRRLEERKVSPEDMKGLTARINQLEADNARLSAEKEVGPNTEVPGGLETQNAATASVLARETEKRQEDLTRHDENVVAEKPAKAK